MSTVSISALDFLNPQDTVVQSAEMLAARVVERAGQASQITISFVGLRGASSSYFNVLLKNLNDTIGKADLLTKIRYRFDTSAQRMVFGRSWQGIVGVDEVPMAAA